MTQVVIAVRGGANTKSRCAPVLSGVERDALTEVMLADMLAALARTRGVAAVWVVTPTPHLAPRPDMRPRKPSHWPSSRPCRPCRPGSAPS